MTKFFVVLKEFLFYVKMDLVKIHFLLAIIIHSYGIFEFAGVTFFIGNQPILYACVCTGMVVLKK